jgi:hypothetical protein
MTNIIHDDLGAELSQPLPDGTYHCVVKAAIRESQKGSRIVPMFNGVKRTATFLVLEYHILDGEFAGNSEIRDWFEMFPDLSREAKEELEPEERAAIRRQAENRATRLEQLGLPQAELHAFDVNKLDGLEIFLTMKSSTSPDKNNPHAKPRRYLNIDDIQLASAVNESSFSGGIGGSL